MDIFEFRVYPSPVYTRCILWTSRASRRKELNFIPILLTSFNTNVKAILQVQVERREVDDESSNFRGRMDANNSIYVLVDYCDHCEVFKLRVCLTFGSTDLSFQPTQ